MRARTGRQERPAKGSRGSTLIEVLTAMALVLVLVVGSAAMLTLALAAKRKGDLAAALAHAVGDRIETLKSRPFDDPALAPGSYAAVRRVEPGGYAVDERWEIAEAGDGVKRVRLRVRAAGAMRPETVAVAYILRDLGFGP